uniref:Kinesin-like protein n=1 Tax=Rhodosorus marinus TaxID=101924 RepID=A0A7S3EEJ2_9RHOD|mmetsp:Transcript_30204/g.115843  ORF Transcript_30204/g.115843 Transcript_30204/m.115843 type:complete len:906 (+) Transcript_30204:140-2857(+)
MARVVTPISTSESFSFSSASTSSSLRASLRPRNRKQVYRITLKTGDVAWHGKEVHVYVQIVGDKGSTFLTRVKDCNFTSNGVFIFEISDMPTGNVVSLFIRHGADLGNCSMQVKKAFVENRDLQRGWLFPDSANLDWQTKNEARFFPSPQTCHGEESMNYLRDQHFAEGVFDRQAVNSRVKSFSFRHHFFSSNAQTIYFSGCGDPLGEWNTERALRMSRVVDEVKGFTGDWYLELLTADTTFSEYRYLLVDEQSREIIFESELKRRSGNYGEEEVNVEQAPAVLKTPDPRKGLSTSDGDDGLSLSAEIEHQLDECFDEKSCSPDGLSQEITMNMPELDTKIHEKVEMLEKQLEEAQEKWWAELQQRRKLFNQLQELRGNVRVFCRCRPPRDSFESSIVDFPDREDAMKRSDGSVPQVITIDAGKSYEFDRVYGPEDSQETVYEDISPLVTSVLDGYDVCIFAYGQTGSGKTYTMNGEKGQMGINHRALEELFQISRETSDRFETSISISMLEIYNENLHDLLNVSGPKLEIKNGSNENFVSNLRCIEVHSVNEVWEVMAIGSRNRSSGATCMNEHSSRSHLVVIINVARTNLLNGDRVTAKMYMVDLAGSERLSRTNATGDRLKEAQHINKSLSALGDVFSSILSNNSHIPFRNSKLTYLLQPALGGDAKTLMFVNISPSDSDGSETLSSLNFASRVSKAELGAARQNLDFSKSRKMTAQLVELEKAKQAVLNHNAKLEQQLQLANSQTAQAASKAEFKAQKIQQSLEEEVHILTRQLRESEKACEDVARFSDQNTKLQKQLNEANKRIEILERAAMSEQAGSAKNDYSSPRPSPPHHQPTRSILAELNRVDIDQQSQGPPPKPTRPSSVMNANYMTKSSIPRPRPASVRFRPLAFNWCFLPPRN